MLVLGCAARPSKGPHDIANASFLRPGSRSPSPLVSCGQFGVFTAIVFEQTAAGRHPSRETPRSDDRNTALVSAQSARTSARLPRPRPPRLPLALVQPGVRVARHLDGSGDARLADLRAYRLRSAIGSGSRHSGDTVSVPVADRRQRRRPLFAEVPCGDGPVCHGVYFHRYGGADSIRTHSAVACVSDRGSYGLRASFSAAVPSRHDLRHRAAGKPDQCHRS